MTTLFNSELSGRDFGSQLLHTGDLMAWAESKRLHLPDIAGFEFVQVEALLCAIERQDLTPEQAFEIVANDPALKNHRAADDPITARWLLGAAAHKKWRELLSVAIERHELTLLDFASKLPINAPATDTATPAPVADDAWKTKAQNRAREIVKDAKARDRYPSQENLGDLIAAEFRKAGIVGTDRKPLTGSTIKRHALKGISSATGKQLSTTIGRGK